MPATLDRLLLAAGSALFILLTAGTILTRLAWCPRPARRPQGAQHRSIPPSTLKGTTPMPPDLLRTAKNAAATITAIYQWVDMVNAAGGTTSIEGVAKCHAMLKSLDKNRKRTDDLIMIPLMDAIKAAEEGPAE